ncbi:MAG: 4a-hydroxytetrahydrobiopterin dehydratase [Actinomycetales bacterium]|jgi:4a-hydroxytetrahydrobiopterin dehydratase
MRRPTPLTRQELHTGLAGLSGWAVDENCLVRCDRADTFATAIGWVVAVARAADAMDHHPDIDIRYREVTWRLSTHSVGALTELDLALARRISDIVGGQ